MKPGHCFTVRGALFDLKAWAHMLKRDVHAVYLAARDPRVPWYAKALALAVAGYALSPIDLIPDFIPVVGYLDDLMLVPLGIWLVLSLIPGDVMAQYRAEASEAVLCLRSRGAAIVIPAIWLAGAIMLGWAALAHSGRPSQVARSSQLRCKVFHSHRSVVDDIGDALPACDISSAVLSCSCERQVRCSRSRGDSVMAWKTPKIVEVPVGMEINMYACAARK